MRFMLTGKLHAMSIRQPPGANEIWLRMPLRNMAPINDSEENCRHLQTQTERIETYHGLSVGPGTDNTFTVYHCIPIVNLISGHERAPGSNGVLVDGCMRHGSRHGDGIGVYTHSGFPEYYAKPGEPCPRHPLAEGKCKVLCWCQGGSGASVGLARWEYGRGGVIRLRRLSAG